MIRRALVSSILTLSLFAGSTAQAAPARLAAPVGSAEQASLNPDTGLLIAGAFAALVILLILIDGDGDSDGDDNLPTSP